MTRSAFPPSITDDDIRSEYRAMGMVEMACFRAKTEKAMTAIEFATLIRRAIAETDLRKRELIDFVNAILDSEASGSSYEDIIHDYAPSISGWTESIEMAKMGEI